MYFIKLLLNSSQFTMKLSSSVTLFLAVLSYLTAVCYCDAADSGEFKLELLQVLFRHGDRTATKSELYATDPYNPLYKEMGYGALTKVGMRRAYKLGEILRQNYSDFLQDYHFNRVHARSTDVDRTKMSLQLVLAGVYPPTDKNRWSDEVMWAPASTYYEEKKKDMFRAFTSCARYRQIRNESLEEGLKNLNIDQDFVDHVRNSTGVALESIHQIYLNIRNILSLGLRLPSWCTMQDLDKLEKFGQVFYSSLAGSRLTEKIVAGPVLETILRNVEKQKTGKEAIKLYLYAGHDDNLVPFLSLHNFAEVPKIIDCGSAIIVEKLRGRDDQIYLRMFYWTGAHSERWLPLKMNNCDTECLLSDYRKLVRHALPDDESRKICKQATPPCEQ